MIPAILAATLAADAPTQPTFWLPQGASTFVGNIDVVFDIINWICYFFFVLVVGLMIVFVVRYRHKKGDRFRMDGPTHNGPMELTWLVVPTLLSIGIFAFGFRGYLDLSQAPKNTYDIQVTAKKWQWTFTYPNGAQSNNAEGLVVPAGTPVQLLLRSDDVLHSCFIPEFRCKKDVVPGRRTNMWFQCDFPTGMDAHAAYNLHCAEYCGTGHSDMNGKVYVLPQEEFDAWVTKQAQWIDEVPDDELYSVAGPRLYVQCSQCHTLDGSTGIGPTWNGLIDRLKDGKERFAGGKTSADLIGPGKEYPTVEDYLRDSMLNPGKHLVEGFGNTMPTFKGQLNERKIDAIIGMMKHLDEFDAKGKWKKP